MKSKKGVALALLIVIVIITILLTTVGIKIIIDKQYFKKGDEAQYNLSYENYKVELEDYISNKNFETNSRYNEYDLNADKTGVYYKGVKQGELTLKDIMPSISNQDIEYVRVVHGELVFDDPN